MMTTENVKDLKILQSYKEAIKLSLLHPTKHIEIFEKNTKDEYVTTYEYIYSGCYMKHSDWINYQRNRIDDAWMGSDA